MYGSDCYSGPHFLKLLDFLLLLGQHLGEDCFPWPDLAKLIPCKWHWENFQSGYPLRQRMSPLDRIWYDLSGSQLCHLAKHGCMLYWCTTVISQERPSPPSFWCPARWGGWSLWRSVRRTSHWKWSAAVWVQAGYRLTRWMAGWQAQRLLLLAKIPKPENFRHNDKIIQIVNSNMSWDDSVGRVLNQL